MEKEEIMDDAYPDMTATYSPQDDKLRLYTDNRLSDEDYAQVKAVSMQWAPKQKCFYGVWSPSREDLLLKWCGHIEDETGSREERAADRADRFAGYRVKRHAEAERTAAEVNRIMQWIPLGQPILVGHHSESHAIKYQKRINDGTRKARNLWDTAEYWQRRASAALSHAAYLEKPAVCYRRIKKLEAEKRGQSRVIDGHEKARAFWARDNLTFQDALNAANIQMGQWGVHDSFCYPLSEYPRESETYEGSQSLYSALKGGIINEVQAAARMLPHIDRVVTHARRWLAHLENRIAYERAMLGEGTPDGKGGLPAQQWDLQPGGRVGISRAHSEGKLLPIRKVNKKNGSVTSVTVATAWGPYVASVEYITEYIPPTPEESAAVKKAGALPPIVNYPGEGCLRITQKEWSKLSRDNKDILRVRATAEHGAYRYRSTMWREKGTLVSGRVFIKNLKEVHIPPATAQDAPEPEPAPQNTETTEHGGKSH